MVHYQKFGFGTHVDGGVPCASDELQTAHAQEDLLELIPEHGACCTSPVEISFHDKYHIAELEVLSVTLGISPLFKPRLCLIWASHHNRISGLCAGIPSN